ncbi:MAG: O-antigen ligase family protein [Armatimonadota bacterium]|nr:O-antigen ligase family protein [Armatimonadota bacterium]
MRPSHSPFPRTDDYDSRRSSARRRSGSPPSAPGGAWRWIAEHPLAFGLVLALIAALPTEIPQISPILRAFILQGLIVALFVLLAAVGPYREHLGRAALRGPLPWLLALLAWSVGSVLFPPARAFGVADLLRPYAIAELLRLLFCAGVFFGAAYGLRTGSLRPLVFSVLLLGAAIALYGFVQFSATPNLGAEVTSLFSSHEPFGSYLMLMLPVALALALDRDGDQKVMLGAQAIAVVLAAALLLARTRSAWVGEGLALLTLALLAWRYTAVRLNKTNKALIVGPLLILSLGLAMLVFSSQLAPLLSQRVSTFHHVIKDDSFGSRLRFWRAACRMTSERPVFGWGLGTFPIIQQRWSGQGGDPEQAITQGTSYWENAHNFWVQWSAETGAVGLFLYVGAVAAFLLSAICVLPTMRPGFPRTLLIGCLAATVGACGDMAGAPSYVDAGVSVLPWFWMGLGLAACREGRRESASAGDAPALPPTPLWVWVGAGIVGLIAAAAVLLVGVRQPHTQPPEIVLNRVKILLTKPANQGIVYQLAFPASEPLRAGGAECLILHRHLDVVTTGAVPLTRMNGEAT